MSIRWVSRARLNDFIDDQSAGCFLSDRQGKTYYYDIQGGHGTGVQGKEKQHFCGILWALITVWRCIRWVVVDVCFFVREIYRAIREYIELRR
jgi:hypothetical protein